MKTTYFFLALGLLCAVAYSLPIEQDEDELMDGNQICLRSAYRRRTIGLVDGARNKSWEVVHGYSLRKMKFRIYETNDFTCRNYMPICSLCLSVGKESDTVILSSPIDFLVGAFTIGGQNSSSSCWFRNWSRVV